MYIDLKGGERKQHEHIQQTKWCLTVICYRRYAHPEHNPVKMC